MPGGVDLVIIDTLSRNMGAHDENSTRDMAALVQQGDKIKDQLGACVLFLHHVNKGGGMRGNTALPGGLDTIITMDRHTVRKVKQDKVTVHCDKQKDSEEFPDFVMKRRHIELGVDSKGAPVRSMVLDWVGYAEKDSEDEPFEATTPEANGPLERRLGMILGSHAHDGGLTTAEWQVRRSEPTCALRPSSMSWSRKWRTKATL
jgi:RecA-family ATPase